MAEKKKTVEQEDKALAAQKHVDELVQKGLTALEEMRKLNQEQVDYIVAKASVAALDAHGELALHAYEETGRGVFEDKATKNLFACEHVVNNMRHTKTVGVIQEDDVTGLTLIAEPVGVVCGITPTTNPTSTAIFKALISLKTRNPIIFAFTHLLKNLLPMQHKSCVMQRLQRVRLKTVYSGLQRHRWKQLLPL